jgi:hypothetical protein
MYYDMRTNTKQYNNIHFLREKNKLERTFIFLREFFMASHKSRSAQRYLRSHAAIDYERHRHIRHHLYIIHPFSLFR